MIVFVLFFCGFATGLATATVAVVRTGSQLEDRAATLRSAAPSRVAAAARRITGLYVRTPGIPAAGQADDTPCSHVGEAFDVPGTELGEARP